MVAVVAAPAQDVDRPLLVRVEHQHRVHPACHDLEELPVGAEARAALVLEVAAKKKAMDEAEADLDKHLLKDSAQRADIYMMLDVVDARGSFRPLGNHCIELSMDPPHTRALRSPGGAARRAPEVPLDGSELPARVPRAGRRHWHDSR